MRTSLSLFSVAALAWSVTVALPQAAHAQAPAAQSQAPVLPAGVSKVTSVEGITEYHLQNGMKVLLFPDPTKATITVNVTYRVGSRHEDYGETGMAHLLEHLLFKGSPKHTDIPKELKDHGSRPNGSTWYDRTNYFETFQATDENLKWALDLESDRMVNSFVAKKDLDSEMTVVRNEFEAGENSPMRILTERVLSTAFLWHNYGKSTIGARSDIEQVPIDRLQAFYRHFYQPDNAMLVVAGQFDEAKTLALVQQYFGSIPKPSRPLRRTYTTEPTQDGERSVVLRRVGDSQALCVAYHIPPGSHEDYTAIDMATAILNNAPEGRLYKALVTTKKAASANSYAYQLHDPGVLIASAMVREEQSLTEAKQTLLATLDGLKDAPFTTGELERARTQWLKYFDLNLNQSESIALELSEWEGMGDWRLLFLQRDRIRKVTLDQVNTAVKKYLVASNRTVGEFVPDKTPVRAEIPTVPDVEKMLEGYKGDAMISQGEAFDPSPENIDKRTIRGDLQGGLKLSFIQKKTRGNRVTATFDLHFGNEQNLKGREINADLAGSMLMRGTAKHTRQQLKDEFDKLKASVMIGGGVTGAMVRVETTRENLAPTLALVAEVLQQPSFPQDEFDQLKQQQLAGLETQKSQPQTLAMTELQRHLSPYPKGDVRYVYSIPEQIEELKTATLDQVKAFYKEFYGASNGEVVIVGDFDAESMQKQLGALFSSWKSPMPYQRVGTSYQAIAPMAKTLETPDKPNAMFVAGMPVQLKDTSPDYPALVLGNYILGSGMGSRLFKRIRGQEGLSYGVGSAFSGTPTEDRQTFMAYAICAPENAPKVEASFKDELAKVLKEGYTAEEVEAAKKSFLQSRQVSRAEDDELARRLSLQRQFGRTMAFDSELEAKVKTLTPEQIKAAMQKYLDPAKISFVRAGDFQKVKAAF